jgi:putative membrane protein
MIRNFAEHAANERTFLAWIRTGIAVIAFGFVLEKFNLFILALTGTSAAEVRQSIRTDRLVGPLGRYEGLSLTLVGVALIAIAGLRFVRTKRLIEASDPHASGIQTEIAVTMVLVVLVAAYCLSIVDAERVDRDDDTALLNRRRAAFWRQWKTLRSRRAALIALGVWGQLRNMAGSGRGPWHLARSKALSVGLSNAHFKSLGLPSSIEAR